MNTPFQDWQAPIDLGASELSPFPKGVFPEDIETFVSELSRATETPLDLAGLTCLAGIATVAHDKYVVEVKPGYFESVNVWIAVFLPPGCRKSAVLNAIMKPIIRYEALKQEEMMPLIAEKISNNKSLEARIKEMRNQAAKAEGADYERRQKEILLLEEELEAVPGVPQLWTADVTAENLATLMVANNECMAILSDEGGIFDNIAGRYSSGVPNLDLFLKSYSGSSARINRVGRPPDLLTRPILTMGLTPQPSILEGLGKNTVFRGRGLLGRFFYALPYSNLGTRDLNASPMPQEVEQSYSQVINAILSHQMEGNHPCELQLSPGAYELWRLNALVIEVKMSEGGPFAFMTDWAGKLPGGIARLAGLIHIARYAKEQPWLMQISEEDMQTAISIGSYLGVHALAVFDLMGADAALDGARAILKWIKKNSLLEFTLRSCHHDHKHRFKTVSKIEPCMDVLVEHGFVRERESEKKPYRPSRVFEVNPLLYEEG